MPEPTTPPVTPSPDPPVTPPVTPPVDSPPVTPPVDPPPVDPPPVTPPVTPPVDSPPVEPPPAEPPPAEPPANQPPADTRVVPKATEYKLPDGAPSELGEFANKNDMTQVQLDATVRQFGAILQGTKAAEQASLKTAGDAHIKNWGENGKFKLTLAKRALQQNDPEGTMAKALETSGYGNHPAVLDFLHTIGKSMEEGGFLKSAVNAPPGKKTLAQSMYPDLPTKDG